jgi:hypothetical protein
MTEELETKPSTRSSKTKFKKLLPKVLKLLGDRSSTYLLELFPQETIEEITLEELDMISKAKSLFAATAFQILFNQKKIDRKVSLLFTNEYAIDALKAIDLCDLDNDDIVLISQVQTSFQCEFLKTFPSIHGFLLIHLPSPINEELAFDVLKIIKEKLVNNEEIMCTPGIHYVLTDICNRINDKRNVEAVKILVESNVYSISDIDLLFTLDFEAHCNTISSLSIEDLPFRDRTWEDAIFYSVMKADLELQPPHILNENSKWEISRQIMFEKEVFMREDYFMKQAKYGDLKLWSFHEKGANGAFHAEIVSENSIKDKIPIKKRLNIVHNALIYAYIESKRNGKLLEFFLQGFDPSRFCIDARTEFLMEYILKMDYNFDCYKSIEDFYNREIRNHMIACNIRMFTMNTKSLKDYLSGFKGKTFKDQVLDDSFVENGIVSAKKWHLL